MVLAHRNIYLSFIFFISFFRFLLLSSSTIPFVHDMKSVESDCKLWMSLVLLFFLLFFFLMVFVVVRVLEVKCYRFLSLRNVIPQLQQYTSSIICFTQKFLLSLCCFIRFFFIFFFLTLRCIYKKKSQVRRTTTRALSIFLNRSIYIYFHYSWWSMVLVHEPYIFFRMTFYHNDVSRWLWCAQKTFFFILSHTRTDLCVSTFRV